MRNSIFFVTIGASVLAVIQGIILMLALLTNDIAFAEKILSFLWMTLAFVALIQVVSILRKYILPLWNNVDSQAVHLYNKYNKVVHPVVNNTFFLLFLSVCAIVVSGLYPYYHLGGDDTRLYYLYPKEFFAFTLRVGPETALSSFSTFLPPTSLALFAGLLVVLKTIVGDLNLQAMLYTANSVAAIWGFYLLTKYLIGDLSEYSKALRLTFGFMYVFSIFIFYTLLNSQLIALFLLSTYPLSLYAFIRGVDEHKKHLLVIAALIWTLFCYFSVSLPWFSAIGIISTPIILFHFRKKVGHFIKSTIFFILVLALFNLHWIAAMPFTYAIGGSSTTTGIASQSFRSQNEQGIRSVAEQNTVFYPLLNTYHADIQKNYNWPYLGIFNKWYTRLLLLNTVWFFIILYTLHKPKHVRLQGLPLAILVSFIVGLYFFTAKIANWGLPLFIWFSNTIPGFVMFRNMYDKFGFAFSFAFAFAVLISTEILFTRITDKKLKRLFLVVSCFLLMLNAAPYLLGKFQNLPIWTTHHSFAKVQSINTDYLELTNYVKHQPSNSRYLWLPLNYGNVSQIQDQHHLNNYYNGTSPFVLFAERNDYSGIMSFERYGQELRDDILARRYASVGKFLQRFNAGYVIVNHTVNDELKKSYLCGEGVCAMQDGEYEKSILGEKIKDFGDRYSLYAINPAFASEKFYVTNTLQHVDANKSVQYKKISTTEYSLHLQHIRKGDILVFLDPYTPRWNFFVKDEDSGVSIGKQLAAFEYANAWIIDIDSLLKLPVTAYAKHPDGSLSLDVSMRFGFSTLYYFMVGLSLLSLLIGTLFVGYKIIYEKLR